jgi:hypothetical protein
MKFRVLLLLGFIVTWVSCTSVNTETPTPTSETPVLTITETPTEIPVTPTPTFPIRINYNVENKYIGEVNVPTYICEKLYKYFLLFPGSIILTVDSLKYDKCLEQAHAAQSPDDLLDILRNGV